jgi:DNA-directed RNA polymerase specialized sigma24 family protein
MTATTSVEFTMRRGSSGSALAEFEQIYRSNVGAMTAYFARRCADPQTVADLTSETIVRAAGAFSSFDPGRGTARGWLFGIAGHVYAQYYAQAANLDYRFGSSVEVFSGVSGRGTCS